MVHQVLIVIHHVPIIYIQKGKCHLYTSMLSAPHDHMLCIVYTHCLMEFYSNVWIAEICCVPLCSFCCAII